jgi:S-DNA-T family DNA segregation ATPase FtsK/SpoIIIE
MDAALKSLDINATCVNAKQHRHLAFFDLRLDQGSRIRKIEMAARELGLLLKSKTTPIVVPCPESGVVRIKVAFREADILPLGGLFKRELTPAGILPFLIGESDSGELLWLDMATLPHLLVSGTTGSGKSTFLHVVIANAIARKDVDLYLSDPKCGVEFGFYSKDATCIAKDYDETMAMLDVLRVIMDKRYSLMEVMGIRNVADVPTIFSKIIVIIDEVADLMIQDANRKNPRRGGFEESLCSLAAKARAAGIYIILATQRPSVDVLTGLIKTNFPARLACKVSSGVDSKVILDQVGAENLLGRGDAIIKSPVHDFVRFQCAFVDKI